MMFFLRCCVVVMTCYFNRN